jgi:hypothetical protein
MPPRTVEPSLVGFEDSVSDAQAFARAVPEYRIVSGAGFKRIGARRSEELTALGLLKIQLAWEAFLENTFTRYMCGVPAPSGFAPQLLQPRESRIEDALVTLLGPNQRFLNWSASNTSTRAHAYFAAGAPFLPPLQAVSNLLEEINAVRNRFAHSSQHAQRQFRAVVRTRLGFVPHGMTVGRFLRTPMDGLQGTAPPFVELYGNSLLGAARAIVPR